ncbi:MAG: TetR/AcrR family transcriptional regulator [Proteobacteria bacterium]|nr:TetR/AcrR family transcriptional regulator [Pseudomonadota bacterium]MCP4921195.1 TetR/AcrR family transcriptional regulator [Pseudomonadota bacterium]
MTTPRKTRGAGRPKGSSGDATRQRILVGARSCFGARGFGATTNRELADAADLTPAALYRYHDSKLALYMAAVDAAVAELAPVLTEATLNQPSGRAELVALAEAAAVLHEQNPGLAAFLSSLPVEMNRHPEITEAMSAEPDPVSLLISAAVERAAREGALAPDLDPGDAIEMIIACYIGISMWAAAIQQTPRSSAMCAYTRLLEGTLFA